MNEKRLSEYKKKYHAYRHHAWAGLGFLSVVLAFRLIFYEEAEYLTPFVVILAIYIIVALIFTYRYRSGLVCEEKIVKIESSNDDIKKKKIDSDLEKERLKFEKKKIKAELKTKKKSGKK